MIRLHDTKSGSLRWHLPAKDIIVYTLAFSRKGQLIAAGSGGKLFTWQEPYTENYVPSKLQREGISFNPLSYVPYLGPHTSWWVTQIAFSPDEKTIAVAWEARYFDVVNHAAAESSEHGVTLAMVDKSGSWVRFGSNFAVEELIMEVNGKERHDIFEIRREVDTHSPHHLR